jgi:hypothetical protein
VSYLNRLVWSDGTCSLIKKEIREFYMYSSDEPVEDKTAEDEEQDADMKKEEKKTKKTP